MLCLLKELVDDEDRWPEIAELKSLCLSLSITRQLNAWLDSLKKTKAVGHRHQTTEKREASEKSRRRDEFLVDLKQVQDVRGDGPERLPSENEPPE